MGRGDTDSLKPIRTHPESWGSVRFLKSHVSEYQGTVGYKGGRRQWKEQQQTQDRNFLLVLSDQCRCISTAVSVIRRRYISLPGSRLRLVASPTLGSAGGSGKSGDRALPLTICVPLASHFASLGFSLHHLRE